MKKTVNIVSRDILYMLTPPMSGVIRNVKLELADIRMCLVRGAQVSEVLPSGKTVKLTLDNYMQDLSKKEFRKESKPVKENVVKEVVKEESKKEEVVKEIEVKEESVVEETKEEVVEEPKKEVKESSVVKEDSNKNRQKNNRKK